MERIFVFSRPTEPRSRPWLFAIPESKITCIETQLGSENCFLRINGIDAQESFDDLLAMLGERCDMRLGKMNR